MLGALLASAATGESVATRGPMISGVGITLLQKNLVCVQKLSIF
jgi:hypothetical protein